MARAIAPLQVALRQFALPVVRRAQAGSPTTAEAVRQAADQKNEKILL
jgi:hypothetical protein